MKTWLVEDCYTGLAYLVQTNTADEARDKILAQIDIADEYREYCHGWQYTQNGLAEYGYTQEPPPSYEEFAEDYEIKVSDLFVNSNGEEIDVVLLEDIS